MTAGRRPPSMTGTGRKARLVVAAAGRALALVVALGIPSGCLDRAPSPSPTSASPTAAPGESTPTATPESAPPATDPRSGLLVLAGRVGAMALARYGPDGRPAPIPLPEPGVAWISAGPDGRLLATTLDGRAFLGTAVPPDGRPAWRVLGSTAPAGTPPLRLSFGTLSPDGSLAAFLATGGDAPGASLVRIDVATGRTSALPLGGEATGWPPAWLGARLMVARRVAADRVELAVAGADRLVPWSGPPVDPSAGGAGSDGVGGIGGSADGRVVAVLEPGYDTVAIVAATVANDPIGSGAPWARLRLEPLADGSALAAWIALSPDATRLAVVRVDAPGDAVGVEIRTAAAGWRRVAGLDLPVGADRAVVSWMP